jgi:chromosome segregation ATPase
MGTNGTDIAAGPRLDEEIVRSPKPEFDNCGADAEYPRHAGADLMQDEEDFALVPLVNKIAQSIARGLVVAMKELEDHIAMETRKVGDTVDRRLDDLQNSLQDLSRFVVDQRSTNATIEGQLQELQAGLKETDAREASDVEALRTEAQELPVWLSQRIEASAASLQEADSRQAADLDALRNETRTFSQSATERIDGLTRELAVHQEDIAALKGTLSAFSSRVDGLVERLDRQADAVRSLCSAYAQRESELEQLVDGLARLRAFPTPIPAQGL